MFTWWQSFLRQLSCCESVQERIQSLVVRCFNVLALLWLCRRCKVRQWTPLSRRRSSRLHLLCFIAAQDEQQSFFTITCTSVECPPRSVRVKLRNHNWYKSFSQQPTRVAPQSFLFRHLNCFAPQLNRSKPYC